MLRPAWIRVGFCVAIMMAAVNAVAAQQMYFRHLTLTDGLSQNTVTSVLQDSQGFVWLGTENGLNRYDGYDIVRYHRRRDDSKGLSGDFIWAIAEDADTNVWVATAGGGISKWIRREDRFEVYRHLPEDPNTLASNSARSILIGRDGLVWVGLSDHGVSVLDPGSGAVEHFRHDDDNPRSLSSDSVYALYQDQAGTIWVGTDGGLDQFNPASRSFVRHRHDPEDESSISNDRVRALYQDRRGDLWVGTFGGGLNRMTRNTGRFDRFEHDAGNEGSLSSNHVRAILEDGDLRLWVGTADGLNLLDRQTGSFRRFGRAGSPEGLSDSYIMSLQQDRGGLMWVGTRSAGANIWNPRSWSLGHFSASWLEDTNVTAFATDGERLFVGTFDDGLTVLNNGVETGAFRTPELSDDRVMSLLIDRRGRLWIGTMGGGLNRRNSDGSITVFRHEPDNSSSLGADGVMSLFEDSRDRIWVGTFGGGLNRFDEASETFVRLSDGLTSQRATTIVEDLDGQLWIGSDAGLNRLNPESGEVAQFVHLEADANSLSNDAVYALHVDSSGRIWVGTAGGGLDRLDIGEQGYEFTNLSRDGGLPSNLIYGILADAHGLLWLSTNSGLARLDPTTGRVKQFHRAHGLQGEEFNFGAHHNGHDGMLYFGGANGFNAILPASLDGGRRETPLVLTSVESLNRPLVTDVSYATLRRFDLDYQSNSVTFEFAALDFTSPLQNQYRYYLEGFDEQWTMPGVQRRATYTNLDAGDYVFRVEAANSDGIWAEQDLAVAFSVAPAPWLTPIAYGIYAAFGLVVGLTIYRIRAARHKKDMLYQRRLHRLAYFDLLTGIPNRQMFMRNLRDALKEAKRQDENLALHYVDLDHFKRINDTLGHRTGDAILRLVTERMQEIVEKTKQAFPGQKLSLARLGGDEFVILQSGYSESKAVDQLARRIIESLSKPFRHRRHELVVTPSVGISEYPKDGNSVQSLVKNADTAMYEAKKAGRRVYRLYSREMNARALEELAIESDLRQALDQDQLELHFQPKVDLDRMEVVGAEALLRWTHPERGEIPPSIFIPVAEKTGLILDVDRWVVKTAAHLLGEWLAEGIDVLPVAVNLSGREFSNESLVSFLSLEVEHAGIPARLLELEITESVLMNDAERAEKTLNRLKTLGFRVYVDDFGTGYSSLSYLKRFPLSALKIDQSFVADLRHNAQDRAICSAIVAMGRGLDVSVIAEGVETVEQLEFLKAQGCDQAQGFLLNRPMPAGEYRALLDKKGTAGVKIRLAG